MPANKKKPGPKINLISQQQFEATTGGRVLTWALSSFRIIVILTELVVIGAFFSRFWLDSKNSNLDDLIAQKQSSIVASKEFEEEFRDIQKRADALAVLTKQQGVSPNLLRGVAKATPSDVILESLTVDKTSISLSGYSADEQSIQQFIANLSYSEYFEKVILNEVGTQKNNQSLLTFTLSLKSKQIL